MTVFAFAVLALGVAVMVLVHARTQKRLAGVVLEQHKKLDGQADAQYKQAKQFTKELARTQLATARVSDECARLLADTRQLHQVVDQFMADPRVKQITGGVDG